MDLRNTFYTFAPRVFSTLVYTHLLILICTCTHDTCACDEQWPNPQDDCSYKVSRVVHNTYELRKIHCNIMAFLERLEMSGVVWSKLRGIQAPSRVSFCNIQTFGRYVVWTSSLRDTWVHVIIGEIVISIYVVPENGPKMDYFTSGIALLQK